MIKRAYYYVFYKLYTSIIYTSEKMGGEFLTDFKTVIVIGTLEIWILGSILSYYSLINNVRLNINITSPLVLVPLAFIFLLNYFSFIHTDTWKKYNNEFDKLPAYKNKKGSFIVWGIIILVTLNFFVSIYLLQKYVLKM
ncbi:hypothetical protein [Chryseobacterium sp.]|uniref:hypothetical protein n=1 Tax=Chryseobacterium sp. TaxID=1871047 RepID=UPI0023554716|nr:hypothetical protein [Chryseobacterium sp.]